jgi:hypothetical protein
MPIQSKKNEEIDYNPEQMQKMQANTQVKVVNPSQKEYFCNTFFKQ